MLPLSKQIALIANGTSLSGAVPCGSGALVAIEMPSAWTTANLTFQASYDGVNFFELYDDQNNELTVDAAAALHIALGTTVKPDHFRGAAYLKVRSGTSGSATNQGADRQITLIFAQAPKFASLT